MQQNDKLAQDETDPILQMGAEPEDDLELLAPETQGLFQTKIYQQSVTLIARMWPEENGTAPPSHSRGWQWGTWRVTEEQLPLVVGALCGGALLLLALVAAAVWRCCLLTRRDKAYCVRMGEELAARQRAGLPILPSRDSAVFLTPKSGQWSYSSRLVGGLPGLGVAPGVSRPAPHWFYNSRVLSQATLERLDAAPVPRSLSAPVQENGIVNGADGRRRPLSQPIRFGPCDVPDREPRPSHLPDIPEFCQTSQYASSSVLDEVGTREEAETPSDAVLKTRSLPAWVRSKSRPLSTEDDLAELYAKVNFSKKRKNRMRNDAAAIIALSKSRSEFLPVPVQFPHKDTDSLVDNEAVIVYDERTAL